MIQNSVQPLLWIALILGSVTVTPLYAAETAADAETAAVKANEFIGPPIRQTLKKLGRLSQ